MKIGDIIFFILLIAIIGLSSDSCFSPDSGSNTLVSSKQK